MRTLLPLLLCLLLAAAALAACSDDEGSVCSQACEQLQGCGISRIHITSVKSYGFDADCAAVACDSITECVSRCITSAQCPALQSVTLGGPFHSCLSACNSWFGVDGGR